MIGKALVACEESQAVCIALRTKGWEAYSCDILPCSGGHPEWHIQEDMFVAFKMYKWDFIGLHSPCTYTCVSGNRYYAGTELRQQGIEFTKNAWQHACDISTMVYLEQPKTIMQKYIGKRTQAIQPWQFGHPEKKLTWLWLKGLPELKETYNVRGIMEGLPEKHKNKIHYAGPGKDRAKLRSKTYPGIARAMADQWTEFYLKTVCGL